MGSKLMPGLVQIMNRLYFDKYVKKVTSLVKM